MNMAGVSIIGWFHSLTCTLAILLGGVVIFGAKGTALHRRLGRWYVYTMIAANVSAFGVYHFDIKQFVPFVGGQNTFGIFHWEAVFTLIMLMLGWYAATRQRPAVWAYTHPLAMLVTYYMLVGGLVNELFVRVSVLRDYAMAHAQGARNPAAAPIAGETQGIVMLIFIAMFVYFIVKVALFRRRFRAIPVAA